MFHARGLAALLVTLSATLLTACGGGGSTSIDSANQPYAVGRTSIEWTDSTRAEQCGDAPAGTRRRLQAYVWYPADVAAGATPSPLLSARQVAFIAEAQQLPAATLAKLSSKSYEEAPVAKRLSSYPVLLMSHGAGGGSPQQYASTAEALAARGYVVVGLSHPYHSVATFYANGDVAALDTACDPLGAQPELTPTSTYADFTANWRYSVRLDAYLTADFASALTQLDALNAGKGPFAGRLALARVGALGHSYGGSHAVRALRELSRVVAAANIDGTVFSEEYAQGAGNGKALMTVLSGDGSVTPAQQASQLAELQAHGMSAAQAAEVADRGQPQRVYGASRPAYLLTLPSARHGNFSDAGLWAAEGIEPDPDTINLTDAAEILRVQNLVLADFFGRHLLQQPVTPLLPTTTLKAATLTAR